MVATSIINKSIDNNWIQTCLFVSRGYNKYMYIPSYAKPKWKIVRLLWIGYSKNQTGDQCLFKRLPKDIVLYIIDLLRKPLLDV